MSDETTTPATPAKEDHGILGNLMGKIGLRGFMYGVGGRKAFLGGGAMGVITLIAQSGMADWPKAIAIVGVGIVGAATVVAIALEDRREK